MSDSAIVFGAGGTLGRAICDQLESHGAAVLRASRAATAGAGWVSTAAEGWAAAIPPQSLTRVLWAHGVNAEGSVLDEGPDQVARLFEANVGFIVDSLRVLLDADSLAPEARLVVLSSIWQDMARERKLAYVISKAALAGLVRSLAADLGPLGISVNAVLPGPVDSPMTRSFLSQESIESWESATPIRRLVTPEEVASTCTWLSGPESRGVNAQFVCVDGGWSEVRSV